MPEAVPGVLLAWGVVSCVCLLYLLATRGLTGTWRALADPFRTLVHVLAHGRPRRALPAAEEPYVPHGPACGCRDGGKGVPVTINVTGAEETVGFLCPTCGGVRKRKANAATVERARADARRAPGSPCRTYRPEGHRVTCLVCGRTELQHLTVERASRHFPPGADGWRARLAATMRDMDVLAESMQPAADGQTFIVDADRHAVYVEALSEAQMLRDLLAAHEEQAEEARRRRERTTSSLAVTTPYEAGPEPPVEVEQGKWTYAFTWYASIDEACAEDEHVWETVQSDFMSQPIVQFCSRCEVRRRLTGYPQRKR